MSDINRSQGRVGTTAELDEAASNWFAVMQSEACTTRDADDFKHWYDADPSHQKAYQDLEKLWKLSGGYADKPEIQALREEVLRRSAPSKSKSHLPLLSFALAAILLAVFLITIL